MSPLHVGIELISVHVHPPPPLQHQMSHIMAHRYAVESGEALALESVGAHVTVVVTNQRVYERYGLDERGEEVPIRKFFDDLVGGGEAG